jgi:type I restriction enzyme S subunit
MNTLGWAPALPDHWDVVPLNFVATMGTGHTPDRSKPEYWENCTIPWITLTDASRHGQSLTPLVETHQLISDVGMKNSAAVLHPAGTVVLSRTASVGHSAIMGRPMATTQDFATWTCGPRLDPRYLLLVLRAMRPEWERLAFGSTHRTIYMPDLESLRIPLPSIDKQRRIGDFLAREIDHLDRLVKLRGLQLAVFDARHRTELTSVASNLQDRYGTVKVRHVLQRIEQGWSPQCEDRTISDGEWGVVKAGCVNGGHFDVKQHKTLPVGVQPDLRYRLHPGDLLMSRASGSLDLIGSVAVLPNGLPSTLLLCDKIYRLKMDRTRMKHEFVASMLSTLPVREQIRLGCSGADGMANNLPTASVANLPLPNVPLVEQGPVVDDLADRWKTAKQTRRLLFDQLARLAERRQALITAAVTGQIDVTTARGVDL